MSTRDDAVINEVRDHISIETLLRAYGSPVPENQVGRREVVMSCPFKDHDDKKPSFSMNSLTLRYQCHGCGKAGDVFSFIAEQEGLSCKTNFPEVLSIAANIANIALKKDGSVNRLSTEEVLIKVRTKINTGEDLREQAANNYFKRKGIDVRKLNITWGAEIDPETRQADIVIPMYTADLLGTVCGAQSGRKRIMSGSQVGVFQNTSSVRRRGSVIYVVEGLSDYLSMLAAGIKNVIGIVSATMDTTVLAKALEEYDIIKICFDLDRHKIGDDQNGGLVGAKKTLALAKSIDKKRSNVFIYELGAEHKFDLNDLYREGGRTKIDAFFEEHQRSLSEFSAEVGLTTEQDSYRIAKLFLEKTSVAIESSGAKTYWRCDKKTNVWSRGAKGELEQSIIVFIESIRSTGHTTALVADVIKYIVSASSGMLQKLKDRIADGGTIPIDPSNMGNSVVLFLKDGKFFPLSSRFERYTPEDGVFATLAVSYAEMEALGKKTWDEKKVRFLSFLNEVLSGPADLEGRIEFIQEWMGYILIASNIFEKFLIIQGPGGNGKSKLLECMENIVGKEQFTNIDLGTFGRSPFITSSLLGTYVNISSEGDRASNLSLPILKKITGGDSITAEIKFENPFQFRPFCKLVIATNPDPSIPENEDWLSRRMQMIRFENSFKGKEDFFLGKKLQKETGFIFWWAIKGLIRLIKRGKFAPPPSVKAVTRNILNEAEYLPDFIRHYNKMLGETFYPNKRGETLDNFSLTPLYREFRSYMAQVEGRPEKFIPGRKQFVRELRKHSFFLSKDQEGDYWIRKTVTLDEDAL